MNAREHSPLQTAATSAVLSAALAAGTLTGCQQNKQNDEPAPHVHNEPVTGANDQPPTPGTTSRSENRTTPVNLNDPRMLAASEEARSKWPEFVDAVNAQNRKQKCLIKSGFALPNNNVEYLWITVTGIEGSKVTGTLNSRPYHVADLQQDQVVTVDSSSVADWLVAEGKDIKAGGFQMEVLKQIRTEEKTSR
jgi:uncharacterized protein YegJ (DUF2314 family)